MARIRTIKPQFFTSSDACAVQPLARLLFQGIWCEADRDGRLEDKPPQIQIRYLPKDDCDVDALLWELMDATLIRRYRADDGRDYIHVREFRKHQRPHPKEPQSVIPADGITRSRPAVAEHGGQVSAPKHAKAVTENGEPCFSGKSPGSIPSSPVGRSMEYGVLEEEEQRPAPPPQPPARGGSLIARGESIRFDQQHAKRHAGCHPEVCRQRDTAVRLCMPSSLVTDFAAKLLGREPAEAIADVIAWARADVPPAGMVVGSSDFRYWNGRWDATRATQATNAPGDVSASTRALRVAEAANQAKEQAWAAEAAARKAQA